MQAASHHADPLTAGDIMSRDLVTVHPDTPLSEAAAPRVSSACFAFRRAVAPHLTSAGVEGYLRQLRAIRRARATMARRFTAAAATADDRRVLLPPVRSLRAGNRQLLAAERVLRQTRDARDTVGPMRRYDRTLPRERRQLRRVAMAECSP